MSYELKGKVKVVQDAQTFGSGFTKRELVVTVEDGKYPQDISLEFVQDNVSKLDGVNEGDEVDVTFDIRGREYEGKYFNNLQAWKMSVVSAGSAPSAPTPPADENPEVPF
jgi:single-strand DNA-binding protein